MSYQVKRIDPYWHTNPLIPVAVVAGAVIAAIGYQTGKFPLAVVGGVLIAIGVLFATKVVVSAVLGTLGVFGGLVTFVIVPNPSMVGMSFLLKLLSSVLFAFLYMVLMDALVLAVSVLYNLFGTMMGGIGLDLEEGQGTEGA